MFGKVLSSFFLAKFTIDVVIVLRGLESRKVFGAAFGSVRSMLGATFHLFVHSLQTPMYENKNNATFRMQNALVMKLWLHQCTKKNRTNCTLRYIL